MRTAILIVAAAALAAGPAAAAGRVYTDAEILGVVMAAGNGELDAAELAVDRARGDAVKTLADRARKDLEDAREQAAEAAAKAGLTPADSAASLRITKDAADESVRLGGLGRDEFDAAYVDAQAEDAAALLRALDEELIPSARDRSVAALLKQVRASAARRLEHARRLQSAGVKTPS
jgi:predicted outer membrane protein